MPPSDVDMSSLILMPAPQTPKTPGPSDRNAKFGMRTSSKLGPPPEVLQKYKLKPHSGNPYEGTYLTHPKVARYVFRITHCSTESTPLNSGFNISVTSLQSNDSADSTSTSGNIPIGILTKTLEKAALPTKPTTFRNPFKAWLYILTYMFHPYHGYEIISYPATGVLIVRNKMRLESDRARWQKKVELFAMRCYTEDHAHRKLDEFEPRYTIQDEVVSENNKKFCANHLYGLGSAANETDAWLDKSFSMYPVEEKQELENHNSQDNINPDAVTPCAPKPLSAPFGENDKQEDSVFEPGEQWLEGYLHALRTGHGWDERDGPRAPAANIFGAVAVGRKVKFLKLVGGEEGLFGTSTRLVDARFKGKLHDLAKKVEWDLELDCGAIEEILECVDDAHWI